MPKVRDALRIMEADGWYLVRVRGAHRQYRHPAKRGLVTIAGADLPGCVATGRTRGEVERNIRAALGMHLKGMADEGLPIPAPAA
ncbi:MAG: addiction module toxin, HicA family [Chloroflexi bacterium]|nr:addiction module toxin, HicA family [Chloroflexota bacterium]